MPTAFLFGKIQALFYGLKISCGVLAKRTDKVLGEGIALINITADFAYKALLALSLRLGLNIILIVGVGHCLLIVDYSCLGDAADEHSVSIEVNVGFNLKRHKGVDVIIKENEAVITAADLSILEFIRVSSADKAKLLKNPEGCFNIEAVDVHFLCLRNYVVGVVCLVDCYGNSVGTACKLRNGVYDKAVILFAVVAGDNVKAVANVEQGGKVVLIRIVGAGNIIGTKLL